MNEYLNFLMKNLHKSESSHLRFVYHTINKMKNSYILTKYMISEENDA